MPGSVLILDLECERENPVGSIINEQALRENIASDECLNALLLQVRRYDRQRRNSQMVPVRMQKK